MQNRRTLVLVIVLGVVVVLAIGWLLTSGDDSGTEDFASTPTASSDAAGGADSDADSDTGSDDGSGDTDASGSDSGGSEADGTDASATGDPSTDGSGSEPTSDDASSTDTTSPFGPPESFDVFATRNPFEPVIQITPTVPPGGTTPTTVPGATTTPGGGTATPGGTGTSGGTGGGSFDPVTGQPVALLDVFVDSDGTTKARVQVGSTVYTVAEGDTFATSYRLVSLDATTGCGQFLFGDAPFELCEGEQVIK